MVLIRRFETKVDVLYRQGRVRGPAHLGMGQEAVAVGAASVLRPGDRSIGTYRGHAHALARGAPPDAVLRELLGREGGICAGKGGSMHITSVEHGYFGSYAIIGAHLPIACGMAWADQVQGDRQRDRLLLRRRHHEHRRVPRGAEHGRGVVAAGGVRLREQPLHGVHPDLRSDRGEASGGGPGRGLRVGAADRRRQRRRRGARRGRRRRAAGPRRRRPGAGGGRDLPARRALGGRPGHLPQRRGGGAVEAARSAAAARRPADRRRCGPGGDRGDRRPGGRGDRADHRRRAGRPTAGRGDGVDGHVERRELPVAE